jgi:dethiobiotin synthetase
MSPLLVITGTGTGIGKTTIACALATAWGRRGKRVAAVKPIESGGTSDGDQLGRASTFHVTRFQAPYLLPHPVSPHLAARREGSTIDLERVVDWVRLLRAEADGVVLELAGGLFTPLADRVTNAELVRALEPRATYLVAPDRLGVLHDVAAATRAAAFARVLLTGIVLSAPDREDASTGSNAVEMRSVTDVPVVASVPRASVAELAVMLEGIVP